MKSIAITFLFISCSLIANVVSRPTTSSLYSQADDISNDLQHTSVANSTDPINNEQTTSRPMVNNESKHKTAIEKSVQTTIKETKQQIHSCCCSRINRSVICKTTTGNVSLIHDPRHYVVSELEYQIVLRRLKSELDKTQVRSNEPNEAKENSRFDSRLVDDHRDDNQERVQMGTDDNKQSQLTEPINESIRNSSDDNSIRECTICLEEFNLSSNLDSLILFCKHKFHRICLDKWLQVGEATSKRCPICKNTLRLDDGKPISENQK